MQQITVLVTCVGGRLVYDFMRALRAAGDFIPYVIGVDADPNAAGRVLCDEFYVLPMAVDEPERYMEAVDQIAKQNKTQKLDVFIALSEDESRLIAKHRDRLMSEGVHVSVSNQDVVTKLTDKLLLLDHARSCGIEVGDYAAVNSLDDAKEVAKRFGYPNKRVVLKPRDGRGSRGVMILDAQQTQFEKLLPTRFCGTGTIEAVADAMQEEGVTFDEMLAMPYYDGSTFDVDCIVKNGQATDVCSRLRQLKNPLWPTSTGHKILLQPEVVVYAKSLCEAFAIDGAGDFDVVLCEGKPYVLDAGARFSGSVGETYNAGYNFPAQLVRSLMDMPRVDYQITDDLPLRPYITMAPIPKHNEMDYL